MKFTVDKQDQFCIFCLQEEKLHSQNAPQMKSEMIMLNTEGVRNIIFDMAQIKFVDSSGLSAILITNRLCSQSNGTFVLTNVHDQVSRLIQISQLDSVLRIVPTLSEAKEMVMLEELEKDLTTDSE
jgi:anti-anti-sigma factor